MSASDRQSMDWIRLTDTTSVGEVAVKVLDHVDWEAAERLLSIGETDQRRLLAYFRAEAAAELAGMSLDEEAIERARMGDWQLAEETFESTDRFAVASAFHALALDQLAPGEDTRTVLDRLMLRFKLGYTLSMVEPDDDPRFGGESGTLLQRRCAEYGTETIRLLESARNRLAKPAYDFLHFRLHFWLGLQWKSLGEYRFAETVFSKAIDHADTAEDRVSCHIHLAEVKTKLLNSQEAYAILLRCENQIPDVDQDTRLFWETMVSSLRLELGGEIRGDEITAAPELGSLSEMLRYMSSPDLQAPGPMLDLVRHALTELGHEDFELCHGLSLQLALGLSVLGDTASSEEADALVSQARALEEKLGDERPKIERQFVQACMLTCRNESDAAVALFAEVIFRAHRILPSGKCLEIACEYLVALGRSNSDLPTILEQVRSVFVDLEVVLAQQPLASARRRIRERHQRTVEAALLALTSAIAGSDLKETHVQEALGWCWRLLMSSRNVEIHWSATGPEGRFIQLANLEGQFHASLRDALCSGEFNERPWIKALSELQDHELASCDDSRRSEIYDMRPDGASVSLVFFKFQEFLRERHPTLVLSYLEDQFDWLIIEDGVEHLEGKLDTWARQFFPTRADTRGRGVSCDPNRIEPWQDLGGAPGLVEILPRSLTLQPFRKLYFASLAELDGGMPRRPMFERPWYIFTNGLLNTLPVEMLPDFAGDEVRFGQNRAVTLCLRPVVPDGVRRTVDLTRGWLGLGDAGEAGAIPPLPGTRQEIQHIKWLLEDLGYTCGALLAQEARPDRLCEELDQRQPAVLHLAVHGFADEIYPEACTLVLSDYPEWPERELLPYRRIGELPLDGVELVVLSACSGLIGRSGHSASMEGLVWAFLRRGVTQVVASRYPVDDEATVEIMLELYRGLLTLPVADALGRARDVCLVERQLDPREVGAWSVWC